MVCEIMTDSTFEIIDRDAGGRIGRLRINNKILETPNIFVVVNPRDNIIPPTDLSKDFGLQAIFTNAYIIYKNLDLRKLIECRTIHEFLGFDGIIATDSGAFQQYMYENTLEVTPEEIETYQEKIESDCPVILDVPVQLTDPWEIASNKISITIQRAKENVSRRTRKESCWFGPIHGTMYLDLVRKCTEEMNKLDFGVYAIGGVVKTFLIYDFALDVDIICTVKQALTEYRPLHIFGLGLPQFFSLAVACGCDTFDSAAYALYAKDNRYFTLQGTRKLENLTEFPCNCPECIRTSPKEVLEMADGERIKVLARHNLYITIKELRTVREAIREGTLWELVENRASIHPSLLDALKRVKKYYSYFEPKELSFKKRGFFYTSLFSLDRPSVFRVVNRVLEQYSPPETKTIALLIPEIDVPAVGSPAIISWNQKIDQFEENIKKSIHIIYINPIFGPVPAELRYTYPFSQNNFCITGDSLISSSCSKKIIQYFKKFPTYSKIIVFRPRVFLSEKSGNRILENHPIDSFYLNIQDNPEWSIAVEYCENIDQIPKIIKNK